MDGFFLLVAGGSLPTQLAFQKVDDPTPGKNKLHVDIRTDGDLDAEVARWVEAGAISLGKRNRRLPLGHPQRPGRERVLHRRRLTRRRAAHGAHTGAPGHALSLDQSL